MSTYNGNDSKIKINCRTMAMTPANSQPVNLLVIAHPEKIDGEWICKDVEILRKSGANIKHIVWVNNDNYVAYYIRIYMDKYFKEKNTGIVRDINCSPRTLTQICQKIGKLNLIYLDYCNLVSPEHKLFWKFLTKSDILDDICKISITLQVHGRNYVNYLKDNFKIKPCDLVHSQWKKNSESIKWWLRHHNVEHHYYDLLNGIKFLSPFAVKKLNHTFGQNARHVNKNGAYGSYDFDWSDIPIIPERNKSMFFKSIFVISAASIIESFKFKSNFKNGKAFMYDADGPNKMSFFSFTLKQSKKGLSKGTLKAKKAGAKRSATVAFQKKMQEAIDNGYSKQRIAGIKAAYTRKINQIEKLTNLELTT